MNEFIIIGGLVVIIFTLIATFSGKLNSLEARIKSLKCTLDQVADQVNVPEHPINEKLRELVKGGKGVQAVKEARQSLGLSLLEAKQYVDKL
ncbi:hypothetical protein [Neobacillus niacini]|uniref:hypothetical protein n=1 Tax=Neobacillus niacini TaxID=86668 RepID=UPI002559AAB1